ncbi:transcription intermediary factor 1-beta-like [Mercenaria mercenaria]|uniref:transcription intermediary factor 1-beta-like n=1 Tax=Mercenaria mercenaria TaxID=6596 RepID=UPI00234F8E86|nr:transcription intermediary factor 1-beta-like [Mercenaria mercenaria]
MAEFADLSGSVQGGSDADFEKSCHPCYGPCFDDGRRTEATKYCPQCKEYLCAACTRCHTRHTRFTATRDHQLTDPVKHNGSGKRKRARAILNPSCSLHTDREIEMFCGSHDMVYCALCIAKDRRLCNNVSEVAEAARCRTLAHTSIGDKISYLRDELMVAKEEKIGNLQTLGTEKKEHFMKVKRTSRKISSRIERLRDEASTSIERKYEKIEQELQADTMTITEAIEQLDKSREQISSLENLNKTQRLCNNVSEVAEAVRCRTLAHTSIGDKISYLRDELMVAKEEKIGNLQTLGTEKKEHLMKVKRTSRKISSRIERLRDEASTSIERKYEKIEQEL